EVPSLIDGDLTVFDSTIILEYLEDKWPTPALRPQQPFARARVRMLEELEDTYHEAINWALAEIRVFGRATGELAAQLAARGGQQIAGFYQRLERELSHRQFFNGERFGWGDICVYPFVAGSVGWGFAPPADSRLAAWLTRTVQRQSVATCAAAAVEAMAGFQN